MGSKIIQLSKQSHARQTEANLYRNIHSTHKLMNALKKTKLQHQKKKEKDDDDDYNDDEWNLS